MSEQIFADLPQVELLQWLARGSLKQNLLRAIRLWVWLRSLYGDSTDQIGVNNGFTLVDWRHGIFTSTHTKGEKVPELHDPHCNCAKTTAAWLFDLKLGMNEFQWRRSLLAHTGIDESTLEEILEKRLFGVTRRSLQGDLQILVELGWLENRDDKYHRVSQLPSRPLSPTTEITSISLHKYELNFLNQEDLAEIAQNLSQEICGVQRFFFKLDYVIPRTAIDQVENWQHLLRELWEKNPVPPIQLTYNSARLGGVIESFVYPVCIYYVQRAVYLCAFGESPDRKTNWYNYRLDRIEKLTITKWSNPDLPEILRQSYQKGNLPIPAELETQMSKAWGFDFYLPSQLMLLRFDRNYHDRYIQNTFRHDTFEAIAYHKARGLILQSPLTPEPKQTLLKVLDSRSPTDAYYSVQYRDGDNNVIMRLRAWRPKVEILMPWDLRQRIAADVTREIELYHNPQNI